MKDWCTDEYLVIGISHELVITSLFKIDLTKLWENSPEYLINMENEKFKTEPRNSQTDV